MFSLTIKQKLYGLGGIVVAAFLIFAGVYLYSNSIRNQAESESAHVSGIDNALAEARIGVLEARRNEKDFLLRKDPKYIEKHGKTLAGVYGNLQTMQRLIVSREGREAVEHLNKAVGEYEKGFQLMATIQTEVGLNEKSGLLGNLRNSVHEVESKLKAFNSDKLTVKMLMMRRHEKDYLAREKDKYVKEIADRKVEFEKLLPGSGIPKSEQATIRKLMDSYHRDFNALVRGTKEVNAAIEGFRTQIHTTDSEFEKVGALVTKLNEENVAVQSLANKTVAALLVVTMIIGGTIILGSVIFLALAVTRGLDEAVRVCKNVAEGRLGLDITPKSSDEIGQLLTSLKFMDENLMRVVSEVQASIASIGSASQEISSGNNSLSQRTEEQASSLEETASSMEEMTGTVKQNADSAAEAKQLADANRQRAIQGAEVVTRTVEAMGRINESSGRISEIIGTIDGIAFQTNLLALNAAVEAARAGDQGRGFAVVASEVRSLAQRSAEAAKEIKGLIEDSVGKVRAGTVLVDESGKTLEEIIQGTQKVADIIAEIAAASTEQASGIDQVNNAITQMDSMTQDNAALVEEAAAAARAMEEQTQNLDQLISFFRVNGQERFGASEFSARLGNGKSKVTGRSHSADNDVELSMSTIHRVATSGTAHGKSSKQGSSEWEQF